MMIGSSIISLSLSSSSAGATPVTFGGAGGTVIGSSIISLSLSDSSESLLALNAGGEVVIGGGALLVCCSNTISGLLFLLGILSRIFAVLLVSVVILMGLTLLTGLACVSRGGSGLIFSSLMGLNLFTSLDLLIFNLTLG